MGSRVIFDHDAATGTSTYFEGDGNGGFTLHTVADCAPVLDANKSLSAGNGREHWKGDFRKEASIPAVILHKWLVEDEIQFWTEEGKERIVRKLNDPDWAYLKTADVMIG